MMAILTNIPRNHEREGQYEELVTVEMMIRRAHQRLDEAGIAVSPSKVSRMVRRAFRAGDADLASKMLDAYILATRSAPITEWQSYCLAYLDPTGETAVRNVLRQGKGIAR